MTENELLGFFVAGTGKKSAPLALPFRAVEVRNASLSLQDDATGATLTSTQFGFRIARGPSGAITGALAMPFIFDGAMGRINAPPEQPGHRRAAEAGGERASTCSPCSSSSSRRSLVCIFADCRERQQGRGQRQRHAGDRLRRQRAISSAGKAAVTSGKASLTLPDWFAEPLDFVSSDIAASMEDGGKSIALDHAQFKFPDVEVSLSGAASRSDAGWAVKAQGSIPRIDMTRLYKYWPLPMVKDTRLWTISKITEGIARDATVKIDVTPQELATHQLREECAHSAT
ncbi:MAG: hypothetical protein WDN72_05665 [Alphaproteobacteria bacterium]